MSLLLFGNNKYKNKQNYFTSKKMKKNKYKFSKIAETNLNFDSKDSSVDNLSSKFVSVDLSVNNLCEANNHVKKQNYIAFKNTKNRSFKQTKKLLKCKSRDLSVGNLCEDDVPLSLFASKKYKQEQSFISKKKIHSKSSNRNPASNLKNVSMDHNYFCSPTLMNIVSDDLPIPSPLSNIQMDHNYVSCNSNGAQSLEMATNILNNVPSTSVLPSSFPKKCKKDISKKKTNCPNCIKMDNPQVFLKTYLNKFCSSFDDLGKKKNSHSSLDQKKQLDIQTARKNQEYGYNFIINKLHTHLQVTCSVKKSYENQSNQKVKSTSFDTRENKIAQTAEIHASSANDASFLPGATVNEENNYDLSEMLFDAKRSSNIEHKSRSRVDKYRLGFLAANNPLRLYNKCLASERYLLSKYEMTNAQRRKLKKMFSSMKNNAAAIEKIE